MFIYTKNKKGPAGPAGPQGSDGTTGSDNNSLAQFITTDTTTNTVTFKGSVVVNDTLTTINDIISNNGNVAAKGGWFYGAETITLTPPAGLKEVNHNPIPYQIFKNGVPDPLGQPSEDGTFDVHFRGVVYSTVGFNVGGDCPPTNPSCWPSV